MTGGVVLVERGLDGGDVDEIIFDESEVTSGGVVLRLQVERHDGGWWWEAVDGEGLLVGVGEGGV